MTTLTLDRNYETVVAALPAIPPPLTLQCSQSRRPCQPRLTLPAAPRRRFCQTSRSLLATMRAAELAAWQATGGDVLLSTEAI